MSETAIVVMKSIVTTISTVNKTGKISSATTNIASPLIAARSVNNSRRPSATRKFVLSSWKKIRPKKMLLITK